MFVLYRFGLVGSLALIVGSAASAQSIHVKVTPLGQNPQPTVTVYPAGSDISIVVDNTTSLVNIWGVPTSTDAGHITISGSGTQPVRVQFGTGSYQGNFPPAFGVCGDLDGISCSRDLVQLNGGIHGDLTFPISGLQVDAFLTEGTMQAGIASLGGTPTIEAGATDADATISNSAGGFGRITILGSAAGDITATSTSSASIGTISIGTPSSPANFSGTIQNDSGTIGVVEITDSLLDDGDLLSPGIIASSTIDRLTIYSNAQAPIQATGVTTYIDVRGNLASKITLTSSLPTLRLIAIGGSLLSTGEISVPANSLAGYIIVNENSVGGSWIGPIKVGTTTLAPNYSNTAASLGGGCASVVRYGINDTDCTPLNGASVEYDDRPRPAIGANPAVPISIRHYGPIHWQSGRPVIIKAESAHSSGEVDQTDCIIPASANVTRTGSNLEILQITPSVALLNGYTYHVYPKVVEGSADSLYCSTGNPVKPVADWEYSFCVGNSNAADVNGSGGVVNVGDFNILASHYGQSGCLLQGDVNGDGIVNVGDFNIVASQFGESATGTCNSASLMARSNDGDEELNQLETVVVKMGFENLGDFSAWLEGLPEQDQLDVLMELMSHLGE